METYSSFYNAREVATRVEYQWTSAGSKSHFSYDKLIDMFESSIITPNDAFVIGLDYRIPIAHGLLDKTYVNKLKMSPSFNAQSFAREYKLMYSFIEICSQNNSSNCWKLLKPSKPPRAVEKPERYGYESRKNLKDGVRSNPKHSDNGQSAAKARTGKGSTTIP